MNEWQAIHVLDSRKYPMFKTQIHLQFTTMQSINVVYDVNRYRWQMCIVGAGWQR